MIVMINVTVAGSPQTGRLRDQNVPAELAELYASIYCRLADCYVLTGQLDRAVVTYERTLPYFQLAASGGTTGRRRLLLELNAHALSMLATVNFLLHNFWRAAVIYETSMMLDHQLHVGEDPAAAATATTTTMESAWVKTMHGLTLGALGREHQSIVWCLRAFAGYVSVLRGSILDVEPLRRWFVVETLYTLARAYTTLDDGAVKAVHYLTVAKNLALAAGDEQIDFPQTIEVRLPCTFVCYFQTEIRIHLPPSCHQNQPIYILCRICPVLSSKFPITFHPSITPFFCLIYWATSLFDLT